MRQGLLAMTSPRWLYWGDCSPSNTLFRRDAGALKRIIDVETGERHPTLSDGNATRPDDRDGERRWRSC